MIGLEHGVVRLAPYTAEWRRLFEEEKRLLQTRIGAYVLDVQHVGSTAIPGMPAKPIIDIGVAVADYEEAKGCIPPIEELGYEYRGTFGIALRHYFVKGEPRTHHLHMVEITSPAWENLVLFRDHLLRHPDAAQEYLVLKESLAKQHAADRRAYLDGKAAFIEQVLERARAESSP